ncbi:uncharacterized protein LOC116196280 [Punica granatum]|uniref:Uncharacterized protein n=2 Tax=Punica granatum TaxID=22663 RepID=A0A2I0JT75_PUNGR|nr:uncharacterized protein LOC116196280 [Punica granatum]PKI58666.1 hypothetical protein CRG98_020932 [Punica granatum]
MATYLQSQCRPTPRFPLVLAGLYASSTANSVNAYCSSAPSSAPRITQKWKTIGKTPRRLVLGFGASFWAQSLNMSAPFGGSGKFLASARPSSSIDQVLKNVEWPEQFPFKDEDFLRFDESPDSLFYEAPRFVTHIDDSAIRALTKYYSEVLPPSNTPGVSILDMCSSWVSHYPAGYKQERIVGMGMNEDELKRNPVLTEYVVQDLNVNPNLPFEDNSFDVITNVVSVDYLTKPLDVFREMRRILKPGGLAIMSFSNRCFWTKAISIWTSTGDTDHVMIIGAYFHYTGGFEPPQAVDISPNPGRSDPMYIVYSRKLNTA